MALCGYNWPMNEYVGAIRWFDKCVHVLRPWESHSREKYHAFGAKETIEVSISMKNASKHDT